MTKATHRTKPLDRDGDGHNGGSLPGNKTAPMAATWSRDDASLIAKLQLIRATLDPALTDAALADEVDGWTDAEAEAVERFADAMAAPGRYQDEAGDERNADGSPIELPPILGRFLIGEEQDRPEPTEVVDDLADARTTPGDSAEKLEAIEREVDEANDAEIVKAAAGIKRLVQLCMAAEVAETGEEATRLQAEADALAAELGLSKDEARSAVELSGADAPDTFTAEEVAAGAQVNEAEGEAPAVAAEPTVISTDGPLVQIETETAPIAVRERELRLLVENRRLYKTAKGYSSNQAPPYVDEATVQAWIAAGLAEDVPSAGNWGGVKPTHEARRQLGLIRHGQAA